ncbi:thiamine ABC transporter substrate binding subunit [Jiella avicenniae]|uniref:Thiamine ABC transporter substrate binding subunit n=1 Tax=Jiella avicenniae TaxID=2907202 RepID=A0A9X1TB17_9HYPH|nr:thiamine ABC transporter substrate binding subunit [Jiella avicenniae]MCE7027688.1 thiamine ABC transporter substrate binding subunit [Jiella avicenniae]MCE7028730.1 thiamine ABC transporter substrate binding subunit [Jiella avicenniae]
MPQLLRPFLRFSPLIATALAAVAALTGGAAAQAGDRPTLTVYTYDSFSAEWGPGPKLKQAFEANCDCTLDFVGLEDGVAILNRLKLEGPSTKADVALGLTSDLIPEAKATGMFTDSRVDLSELEVPTGFSDPVFVPYDYSYLAFVYDSESVENPPKSLADLVSGDPDQKIAIEDPRTSTPGLGFLLWMKAVYGDEAAARWEELRPRILTVTPGWSEAYGLFTKGEVPIVLSYTTSPAYHAIEEGTDRYKAAGFAEGQYLQIEVAGVLKETPHAELARTFLSFLVGKEAQAILPTTNWTLPVRDDIDLPEAFSDLVSVDRPLLIDPETVAKNRRAWTDEWLQAVGAR